MLYSPQPTSVGVEGFEVRGSASRSVSWDSSQKLPPNMTATESGSAVHSTSSEPSVWVAPTALVGPPERRCDLIVFFVL